MLSIKIKSSYYVKRRTNLNKFITFCYLVFLTITTKLFALFLHNMRLDVTFTGILFYLETDQLFWQ